MLPKHERIKYNGLFQQAYEKGKKLSAGSVKITFTETRIENKEKMPLVGFVVSKAFSKKAVIRNKIKRRLREVYRLYRSEGDNPEKLKSVGLLVISVRGSFSIEQEKNPESYSYSNLKSELESLLNKI